MNAMNYERYVTAQEAAAVLNLKGRRGLDRMRREGRGPRYVRLGHGPRPRIRYRMQDLIEFLRPSGLQNCNQLQKEDV